MWKDHDIIYTGRGVWIAACRVDEKHYYAVRNDDDTLRVYDDGDSDGFSLYPLLHVAEAYHESDIIGELLDIYDSLRAGLEKFLF